MLGGQRKGTQAKEHRWPPDPDEGNETDSLLIDSRRNQPGRHLDLSAGRPSFLVPRTVRD